MSIAQGLSLVKRHDGTYYQVENPSEEEVQANRLLYLGGHIYWISPTEAASLTAAGYGQWIVTSSGYGDGEYGSGDYGGAEAIEVSGYGVSPYGGGYYGEV